MLRCPTISDNYRILSNMLKDTFYNFDTFIIMLPSSSSYPINISSSSQRQDPLPSSINSFQSWSASYRRASIFAFDRAVLPNLPNESSIIKQADQEQIDEVNSVYISDGNENTSVDTEMDNDLETLLPKSIIPKSSFAQSLFNAVNMLMYKFLMAGGLGCYLCRTRLI